MEYVLLGVRQGGMEIHVRRNAASIVHRVNVTSRMVTASAAKLGELVPCVKVKSVFYFVMSNGKILNMPDCEAYRYKENSYISHRNM